ncbi:MAG: hypothetical protein ACRCX8_03875, partial [Sarcina sp.]
YVTFLLNKNAFSILKNTIYIRCCSFKLKEILYIKDFNNNILDFNCPTPIKLQINKLSFASYIAKLVNIREVILESSTIMQYKKLYPSDFYIENSGNIYFPTHIKINNNYSISFIFDEHLIFKRSSIITLKSIEICKSTDLIDEYIAGNDSLNILNALEPQLINISIISYRNETLKLILEFTDKLLRFNGKDFTFIYNNKKVSSKDSSRFYNNDFLELTLNNISDFNPLVQNLLLLENRNTCIYTIDEQYQAINFPAFPVSELFYCQRGIILPLPTLGHYSIEIAFNKSLLKTLNGFSSFATASLITTSELTINFDILGYITIFGTKLSLVRDNVSFPFNIIINDNILIITLDLSSQNLININQNNISYIDFTPNTSIKNTQSIHAFESYECPIIFKKEKIIICSPENQSDSWSLLGQNIYLNTILQVDKQTINKFYGSKTTPTIFHQDLRIDNLSAPLDASANNISLINIQGSTLYINATDNTNLDIIDCKFQSIEIIEEDL